MSKTGNKRPITDKELRDAGLDEETLRELYNNEEETDNGQLKFF